MSTLRWITVAMAAGIGFATPRAEASLVLFDFAGNIERSTFHGISAGSGFTGTLAFDTDNLMLRSFSPPVYDGPLFARLNVGPYSFVGTETSKGGVAFLQDVMFVNTVTTPKAGLIIGAGAPGLTAAAGTGDLDNVHWPSIFVGNAMLPGAFFLNVNNSFDSEYARGAFTRFDFKGPIPPAPEPGTIALFGSAFAAIVVPTLRGRRHSDKKEEGHV